MFLMRLIPNLQECNELLVRNTMTLIRRTPRGLRRITVQLSVNVKVVMGQFLINVVIYRAANGQRPNDNYHRRRNRRTSRSAFCVCENSRVLG